jgi:Flp pilus assembly protein TadG
MKLFSTLFRSRTRRDANGRTRRGGTLIETAIVLPVLLSVAFGTCEFGYYFYVKNIVQGAAREGARAAIISTAVNSDVTTAVSNAMTAAGIPASKYTVTLSPTTISGQATGTAMTVTVAGTWTNLGLAPIGLIPSSKSVSGVATMRKE